MLEDDSDRDARRAAEMDPDVDRRAIGALYADALLSLASDAVPADTLMDVFDAVVHDVLDSFPDFERILHSALVSRREKLDLLDRVFATRVPTVFLDFLKVVASHDRMDCLRAIHAEARDLYDENKGRVRIELTTAVSIDDATATRIADQLRELLGGEPLMGRRVDPDLIGGAVVRVGDTIYDGSIATQLQIVCQQMIDRSVHEIQSRRNRLGNSPRD